MTSAFRRFELLLPLQFNDGSTVPTELVAETLLELRRQFGAVSCETQSIIGHWNFEGETYRDKSVRVFVDVPDTSENRDFFVHFKEVLKSRFQQLDIWVTTYPLDVL